MPYREDFIRPGGTIGRRPALFGLADVALYGAVLSRIGRIELAVTTSMTINFLAAPCPAPVGVLAARPPPEAWQRRLAYGEVLLRSDEVRGRPGGACVTGTYSIPPR